MHSPIKNLSVIVPLFNEANRITRTLPIIDEELKNLERRHGICCELIYVDDGSVDDTPELIKKNSKFHAMQLVSLPRHTGKGGAIKRGFEEATGDYILFMDADLSTPMKYIETFLGCIADDRTILIGSRKVQPGLMKVKQSFIRRKLGHGFTVLCNLLMGTSATDFTCGFKMFPMEAGKRIFDSITISGWGFDAEVIYLANVYNYRIREIPVSWFNDEDSRVRLSRDIIGSLWDIIKIKMNSYGGIYENK